MGLTIGEGVSALPLLGVKVSALGKRKKKERSSPSGFEISLIPPLHVELISMEGNLCPYRDSALK
ncbi:hypothetical protein Taro_010401 [Colocasia esculenta]|uniref:Uncharacterized protein n=1 Tax=Colocasia esculenta TaxID=4460 RepID=A0A843TYT8_COLES|nr:hypothetical protein [Colocasia esculenta]